MSELLTTRELAELWSCSTKSINRLRLQSGLPSLKLGHSLRFRRSDIEAWLEAQQPGGTAA